MKPILLALLLFLQPSGSYAISRHATAPFSTILTQDLSSDHSGDTAKQTARSYQKRLPEKRGETGHAKFLRAIKLIYAGGIVTVAGAIIAGLGLAVADGVPLGIWLVLLGFGVIVAATGIILAVLGIIFYFIYRKYRSPT